MKKTTEQKKIERLEEELEENHKRFLEEKNDDFYRSCVRCLNCGHTGTLVVFKGVRVSDKDCPNCKCNTLILAESPTL